MRPAAIALCLFSSQYLDPTVPSMHFRNVNDAPLACTILMLTLPSHGEWSVPQMRALSGDTKSPRRSPAFCRFRSREFSPNHRLLSRYCLFICLLEISCSISGG